MSEYRLNVVLYHPEIPQNTGNIMRSCVGFHCKLHLIQPLGFQLDEKKLRRSCVDYFDALEYEVYDDFSDFEAKNPGKYIFLTRYGHRSPSVIPFRELAETQKIYLIFGAESTGIAYDILKSHLKDCYRIPTTDKIRSLNLANCAAIVMFLAREQISDDLICFEEPDTLKGKNFLENLNLSEIHTKNKEYKGGF